MKRIKKRIETQCRRLTQPNFHKFWQRFLHFSCYNSNTVCNYLRMLFQGNFYQTMPDLNFQFSSVIVVFIVRIRARVRVGFASLGLLDLLHSGLENGHRQKGRGGRELRDRHRWDFWIVLRNGKYIRCLIVAFTAKIQAHVTFLAIRNIKMSFEATQGKHFLKNLAKMKLKLTSSNLRT